MEHKLRCLKEQSIEKRLKTITTYVNNGNIKKLWSEIKRIKNNGPKQITELTTPNNTTACNTTQLIATQTEYIY